MNTLSLEPDARRMIERSATAGYPLETCGLLLARGAAPRRVTEVWPLMNVAAVARHAFAIDPIEYMQAERRADALGLQVVGIWHSHPDAAAVPSDHDRASAWPEWSYLIVAAGPAGVEETRCWRLCGDRFVEEIIEP